MFGVDILEQLQLSKLPPNTKRYTGHTMILASTLFIQSSASYFALYHSQCICLPHPRNIKKVISKMSSHASDLKKSIDYLKSKMPFFKDQKLIINIHLDEMYVDPVLNFKGDSILGSSSTDPTKVAKTVQAFMQLKNYYFQCFARIVKYGIFYYNFDI